MIASVSFGEVFSQNMNPNVDSEIIMCMYLNSADGRSTCMSPNESGIRVTSPGPTESPGSAVPVRV